MYSSLEHREKSSTQPPSGELSQLGIPVQGIVTDLGGSGLRHLLSMAQLLVLASGSTQVLDHTDLVMGKNCTSFG